MDNVEKGCGEYLYTEGYYHQLCDGVELCNNTLRLCDKCKAKDKQEQ